MNALLHDFDDGVLLDVNAPVARGTYDIMMLLLLSGMERSDKRWRALLESLGLVIQRIWRKEGVGEAVIEARKP